MACTLLLVDGEGQRRGGVVAQADEDNSLDLDGASYPVCVCVWEGGGGGWEMVIFLTESNSSSLSENRWEKGNSLIHSSVVLAAIKQNSFKAFHTFNGWKPELFSRIVL